MIGLFLLRKTEASMQRTDVILFEPFASVQL